MNDDTGVPAAVFALKPEWADLILSGAKTVEIRRGRMKRMIGRMLIYRTGTGLIVGEARVKGMHAAPPETLSDIGLKRAPQSWCYLPETGPAGPEPAMEGLN